MTGNIKTVDTNEIIGHLSDLSSKTEKIFLNLGFSLPALFREIEGGTNKAKYLIEVFSKESMANDCIEQDNPLSNSLERAEAIVEYAADFFTSLEKHDSKLFETINNNIDCLDSLENRFIEIREDSIDMEVVSLNSKIAAIKTGKHSSGFICISDELRKLSKVTTDSTGVLTTYGNIVLHSLTSFTKKIKEIQSVQQSFYEHFRDDLKNIFRNYNAEVNNLIEHLISTISDAESVKKPLFNIMEIIQFQDIIRQSLQHVELVLKETEETNETESVNQILDKLTFIEIIYQLCRDLLGDIRDKLIFCIDTFSLNITALRSILFRINQDDEYTKISSDSSLEKVIPQNELTYIVSESVKTLDLLFRDLDRSLKNKNSISTDAKQIILTLDKLEDGFMASLKIVSQFYPVNINARVEVAKWDILNTIGVATDEISEICNRINSDMKKALKLIKKIKIDIESSISLYTEGDTDETCAIIDITDRIKNCYNQLVISSETLSDTLHSFSVYSESFFSLLDKSELEIIELEELIVLINDICRTLQDSERSVKIRRNEILSETDKEEWILKSSKLGDIINKFTIFTHKQTAKDIAGIDIIINEEAAEVGELTLF